MVKGDVEIGQVQPTLVITEVKGVMQIRTLLHGIIPQLMCLESWIGEGQRSMEMDCGVRHATLDW